MANDKTTHVVCHKSLYLRINGRLQELKEGQPLTLDKAQAKRLEEKGFVKPISAKKSDVSGKKKDK